MKDHSRALRRHHDARLKKKRQSYYSHRQDRMTPRQLGRVLHTPAVCSCFMCGNPRKYFDERSVQERRWMQVVEE